MLLVYFSAEENFEKCSGFIYKISVNEKGEKQWAKIRFFILIHQPPKSLASHWVPCILDKMMLFSVLCLYQMWIIL